MLGYKFGSKVGLAMAGVISFATIFAGKGTIVNAAGFVPQVTECGGWLESAYVEWDASGNADGYNVYVEGSNGIVRLDDELIRLYASESGEKYYRADALGLAEGEYSFRVVPVEDGKELGNSAVFSNSVSVSAHDRSGFGFVDGTSSGAYNENGTLKDDAVVLYVTEDTKDSVSLDVVTNAKGATTSASGLQNILNLYKKGYDNRSLDVRFIGQITDFATMEGGDICISGSGDSKRLSCGITFEGVGEDATADGWGLRIKNASNVEVRNLGFMNCDSSEGDNIGLQQSNDHVWVHNCDLFYGLAGGDADQAKGDGALDTKKSTNVTHSYNHFYDTGKSNLQGMKSESTENYITYHHNWYDHSDSRHPRIRTCSVHIYNNYYDGNAKYGVGVTMGASVFVENNYFRHCKFPMLISEQGSDVIADWNSLKRDENLGTFSSENGGIIKSFNNYMEDQKSYVTYQENATEFDAYEVSSRDEEVPSSVVAYKGGSSYNNFDTSSKMYAYTADDPMTARDNVMAFAGRENGGDFKWEFNNAVDDTDYSVNKALKAALNSYKTKLIAVGGKGCESGSESGSESSSDASSEENTGSASDAGSEASSESGSGNTGSEGSSEAASEASSAGQSETPVATEGKYVHNFTAKGLNSDFYTISGTLSTSKGQVEYDGKVLTQCLKIESKTSVKFKAPAKGKLTLVFGAKDSSIKVDGKGYTDASNIITLELEAGDHELTKKDVENLFYIVFETEVSAEPEKPGEGGESSGEASSESSSSASSEDSGSEASSEASSSESGSEASSEASSQEPEVNPSEPEELQGKWLNKWGTYYYVLANGEYAKGLQVIDGETYYFAKDGRRTASTFVEFKEGTRFFDKEGKLVKGWMERWSARYYFDQDGILQTGLKTIDGTTYYFRNDGIMFHSNFIELDNSKYYFNDEGKMATGWLNKWGSRYHFGTNGIADTGKTLIDGSYYFFTEEGRLVTGQFVEIDGNTYYFDNNGKMYTGKLVKWFRIYYFDENGILIK